jgi:hypothetical protein
VGTIDARSGAFTYSVPTFDQTLLIPPIPPQKTNSFFTITAGMVQTDAVDLLLKFDIINGQPSQTKAKVRRAVGAALDLPTGIQINGFPTIVSNQTEIILDAGLACSQVLQSPSNLEPPLTRFDLAITVPGRPLPRNIHFVVVRPPILGFGAFTIPAIPITLVYTPPQGQLQKNFAQYTDQVTLTRSMTSSFTTSTATKTADAYSVGDILGKAGTLLIDADSLVAAGSGAGAGGNAGDALKAIGTSFKLFSDILGAVGDTTTDTTTVTVENDHSVTLAWTDTNAFGTATALGPGVGDRFIYMNNVRMVWMALNGEVAIHILGFDKIRADTAQTLLADQQAILNGQPTVTGLDAQSLQQLISLDPFCIHRSRIAVFGPPLIGPPRFVPATPPEQAGTGTSPQGDQISAAYEVTLEDKKVETNVQVTITDVKPGWLDVVFGEEDAETTTTMTVTMANTTGTKTDEKITDTAAFFSAGADDPYDVKIFYDRLFGTLVFVDRNSPALTGIAAVRQRTFAAG